MPTASRQFDVWIVETNTVYRAVPYTVICDWVQQGRLLDDDRVRPAGAKDWLPLRGFSEFTPYQPKVEPFRADDQAEALEPVQLDFGWRRRTADDEDEDVDMIPLIDVSLVLLIFFMMTATAISASSFVTTPPAYHGSNVTTRGFWVGVKADGKGDPKTYLIGHGDAKLAEEVTWERFLQELDVHLGKTAGTVEATVLGDKDLKSGVVRKVLIELEKRRVKVRRNVIGVSEGRQ